MTREELIARLEAASGPDRGLDAAIWLERHPNRDVLVGLCNGSDTVAIGKALERPLPAFTASIDAALTLVPEGWAKDIWLKRHSGYHWQATLHIPSYERDGRHREAPIALCIAALKASAPQ